MKSPIFSDRRATGLLDRVRNDVSRLTDDIGSLLTHTTRETLPHSARGIADQAKHQLAIGSAYAVSRLRGLRSQPHSQSGGWVGGAVVVGLIAYGVYALCQNSSCEQTSGDSDYANPDDEVAI